MILPEDAGAEDEEDLIKSKLGKNIPTRADEGTNHRDLTRRQAVLMAIGAVSQYALLIIDRALNAGKLAVIHNGMLVAKDVVHDFFKTIRYASDSTVDIAHDAKDSVMYASIVSIGARITDSVTYLFGYPGWTGVR